MRSILCAVLILVSLSAASQKNNYPNTLLWRITGKDLKKPSYLFGTMHLQDRRIFHFSDSLYYYLNNAEGYAMELNADDLMAAIFTSLDDRDTTGLLKDYLSPAEFRRISRELEKQLGIPAEKITKKQAWLYKKGWSSPLKLKETDMSAAVDFYLYNIARRQGKWVGGIEDIEDQMGIINDVYSDFNKEDLLSTKSDPKLLERMIQVYIAQDLNQIATWVDEKDTVVQDKILFTRNRKMAHRIDSMARERSNFFAVGAAHLPGTEGLIQLLQEKGFRVEPVISSKLIAPEEFSYTPVALPWVKFEPVNKIYSVSMPGKAVDYSADGFTKMHLYGDLGTGLTYFNMTMPISDYESKLQQMGRKGSKSKTVFKKITYQGIEGLESLTDSANYFYRMRVLPQENYAVMVMVGSQKKSLLYSADADKFFESLVIAPQKSAAQSLTGWYQYKDERNAVALQFPFRPESNKALEEQVNENKNSVGWNVSNQGAFDQARNVYYMFIIKETPPGFYITSDSSMFAEARNNLESKGVITVDRYEKGLYQGSPALWLDGSYVEQESMRLKSFHVNRGNRSYSLMTIYFPSSDTLGVRHFFDSFRLLDFQKAEWRQQSDSANTFTTLAPAPFITINEEINQFTGFKSLVSFDSTTAFSFHLNSQALSPYYWTENDSTFYAELLTGFLDNEDSVLTSHNVFNGKAKGREFRIRMEEGRNIKFMRLLPNSDTLYALYLMAPAEYVDNPDYRRFFTEFRFMNYRENKSLFENKTRKLLADLRSADSAVHTPAKNFLNEAPFTKKDLHQLHDALRVIYPDSTYDYYSTYGMLSRKVSALQDPGTISFVKEIYPGLTGHRAVLKSQLLTILAKIRTQESYDVIKSLLLNDKTPWVEVDGLAYPLSDSLALLRTLYPELLALSRDTVFIDVLVSNINTLVDSGYLAPALIEPYKPVFLARAEQLIKRYENEEENWSLYRWVNLLGHFNDIESNRLLQQVAKHQDLALKMNAVEKLLQNRQTVAGEHFEKLAADKYYRVELYELLKKSGQLGLFPARYLNQKSIAESELFQYLNDDEEDADVAFYKETTARFRGTIHKFFLFKVHREDYEGNKSVYLGIAGPYSPSEKAIVTDVQLKGTANATFDPKQVNTQLAAFLKDWEEYLAEEE